MKILLFNDNPVVRKLVALSAQKTKDDLSVVWTIDEAQGGAYDLLIVDDGVYSDEMLAMLKEKVPYSVSLLMATRGNAVPAGFDHVINKPFLPTDLVDTFVQIQKKVDSQSASAPEAMFAETPEEEAGIAINLDEELPDLDEGLIDLSADTFGDDLTLEGLEGLEEEPFPNILDEEEVKEVRNLLEETEEELFTPAAQEDSEELSGIGDDLDLEALSDEEMHITDDAPTQEGEGLNFDAMLESLKDDLEAVQGTDDFDMEGFEEEMAVEPAAIDDLALEEVEEFDFEGTQEIEGDEALVPDDEFAPEEELSLSGLEEEEQSPPVALPSDDELFGIDEDPFALETDETESVDELAAMDEDENELGSLEQRILDAVGELGDEELDMELDASELGIELPLEEEETFEAGTSVDTEGAFEGLDEFDMLDERELKMAIGEEVDELEEEPQIRVGAGSHAALDAEALEEAFDHKTKSEAAEPEPQIPAEVHAGSTAEGVEALQALLKALSNEEVAKSLKNLNISININFGNNP